MKKKIAVLGSTGSIGTSTLKVAEHLRDKIQVTALAAHSNIDLLEEQIALFKPEIVAVFDEAKALELKKRSLPVKIVAGESGLDEIVSSDNVDFVVMGIVGMAALKPTIKAIECKKEIGLANKEVLVAAGELITRLARKNGVTLIPIDSEHSAIFQCLHGRDPSEVRRIILTASGGPFREYNQEQLASVTVEEALNHPTWKMGSKVTIDSSTLMNKGLEMIEASWLFNVPPEKIEVVIHPQSIIHSMVEWIDGSILAQLSEPNMIFPIQYALTYPGREEGSFPPFDFQKRSRLDFFAPDREKFPALDFSYEALRRGDSLPCYLNAANEILVDRFLQKEISWQGIANRLKKLINHHSSVPADSIESVLAIDDVAREEAKLV
ncbi:MAG: 1-deoxy-D-xylulose 5-phosphate reductoisomerase [Chlamydiae bacterium]|nr:1-deoxy-D-xylulose 5-phosphate reductoisomerase [Chlamydiota bacterium]